MSFRTLLWRLRRARYARPAPVYDDLPPQASEYCPDCCALPEERHRRWCRNIPWDVAREWR